MESENPGGRPGLSQNAACSAPNVAGVDDGVTRLQAAKRAALLQWVRAWYQDEDDRGSWADHFGAPSLKDVYAADRGRQFDGFGQFTSRREADAAVAALVDVGLVQLRARRGEVVLIPIDGQG